MQFPEWGSGIGKHILRLKDGDSIQGVFRGEITRFYQHWKSGRSIICPGRDTCDLCQSENEDDRRANGRFRINFLIYVDGQWGAKVFEGGKRVFEQLKALNQDCPLEKMRVRISKSGEGKNSQIVISPVPGEAGLIKPAVEKELQSVELIDLAMGEQEEKELEEAPF